MTTKELKSSKDLGERGSQLLVKVLGHYHGNSAYLRTIWAAHSTGSTSGRNADKSLRQMSHIITLLRWDFRHWGSEHGYWIMHVPTDPEPGAAVWLGAERTARWVKEIQKEVKRCGFCAGV